MYGQLVHGNALAERNDPSGSLLLRRVNAVAVDDKKRVERDQRRPFVPLKKVLTLADPVCQDNRLKCDIRSLVMSICLRASKSGLESHLVSKPVPSLLVGS